MCELDIIFNFEKAYYILDEFILGGEAQETSKKNVLKAIEQADMLQEVRIAHSAHSKHAWRKKYYQFFNIWMDFLWFLNSQQEAETPRSVLEEIGLT